jgi:hypothetical protein
VTDGAEDLVYTLRKECLLKRIRLPAYFDRFFDLCKEFNKFYPEYGAKSLMDMAQCLGVARKAATTGMENCKIISNIIASVLREGYAFLEPVVIRVTFDPFALQPPAKVETVPSSASAESPLPTTTSSANDDWPSTVATPPVVASGDRLHPSRATSPLSYKAAVVKRPPRQQPQLSGAADTVPDLVMQTPVLVEETPAVRLRGLPWGTKEEEVRWWWVGGCGGALGG